MRLYSQQPMPYSVIIGTQERKKRDECPSIEKLRIILFDKYKEH